jgi:CheY-like chemotaxis protein
LARDLENLAHEFLVMVSPGEEALEKTEEYRSEVVLTDIFPDGDMNGIEAAEQIDTRLDIPAAYLSACSDPGLQVTRPGPLS